MLSVVHEDKREALLENEHGERFHAQKETTFKGLRRVSRWVTTFTTMQNLSDTKTGTGRTVSELRRKLEKVDAVPTSRRR